MSLNPVWLLPNPQESIDLYPCEAPFVVSACWAQSMGARPKAKSQGRAKKDSATTKSTNKMSLKKEGKQIGHAVESLKQQRALFRRDFNE